MTNFSLAPDYDMKLLVVKQFTDIPINRGPFKKKKNETGSNFTVPYF